MHNRTNRSSDFGLNMVSIIDNHQNGGISCRYFHGGRGRGGRGIGGSRGSGGRGIGGRGRYDREGRCFARTVSQHLHYYEDDEVQILKDYVIAESSRVQYDRRNSIFHSFLFDDHVYKRR